MQELTINENIRFKEVLLIDQDGNQLGLMHTKTALAKAQEADLDLVCVAPRAVNPVCKIMDYGKYKFEQQKKERAAKKNQHNSELSEIQLTYTIQEHDIQTKVKTAKRLIKEKGNYVRVVLRLRGRETTFIEEAKSIVDHFIHCCEEFAKVKKEIFVEGRDITAVIEGR